MKKFRTTLCSPSLQGKSPMDPEPRLAMRESASGSNQVSSCGSTLLAITHRYRLNPIPVDPSIGPARLITQALVQPTSSLQQQAIHGPHQILCPLSHDRMAGKELSQKN